MPKSYPNESRYDVVAVARRWPHGTTLKQIAADFAISDSCLANGWPWPNCSVGGRPITACTLVPEKVQRTLARRRMVGSMDQVVGSLSDNAAMKSSSPCHPQHQAMDTREELQIASSRP